MLDIHARGEAIRAEGLQGIALPFRSLIVAAKTKESMSFKVGTQKDLPSVMEDLFIALPSTWIILGLLDLSNPDDPIVGDSDGLLGVLWKQVHSKKFLDDLWLLLRSFYEYQVTRRPEFPELCRDTINYLAYIQMLRKPPDGHC